MSSRSRAHPWFAEGVSIEQRLAWEPGFKLCRHGTCVNDDSAAYPRVVRACWRCDADAAGYFIGWTEKWRPFGDEVMRDGFDLICIEHGIYGRVSRGDRCGLCVQRAGGYLPK